MRLDNTVVFDVETRSACDLITRGARRYAKDPTTTIICVCYTINGGDVQSWLPTDPPFSFPDNSWVLSFNIAFDFLIVRHKAPFLLPGRYKIMDIKALAQYYAYGGSLEIVATRLGLGHKVDEGKQLIRQYCTPKTYRSPLPSGDLEKFIRYCKQDTVLATRINAHCPPLPPFEYQAWVATMKMNKRGVLCDVVLFQKIADWFEVGKKLANDRCRDLCGLNVTQTKALAAYLGLSSVEKKTLERYVAASADGTHKKVAKLRLQSGAISLSRAKKVLLRVNSKQRLQDAFVYCGTHTGRLSSLKVQLHNLPRESLPTRVVEEIRMWDAEKFWREYPDKGFDILKKLLRPAFFTKNGCFLVGDFDQIEARIVAWLGEQPWDTSIDYYQQMAEAVNPSSPNRAIGKQLVLGCGFGMGGKTFRERLNVEQNIQISEEEARQMVAVFRRKNAGIVRLWRRLEAGVKTALYKKSAVTSLAHLTLCPQGVRLPSGRSLNMPYLALNGSELYHTYYKSVVFAPTLVENVVQAIARDVMQDKVFALEREGLSVVMTVHDEIIVESKPNHYDTFTRIMNEPVTWASGLPVTASCVQSRRYGKF